jgi:hypothetical protein
MDTKTLNHLNAAQLNRLHDQARREASVLRDAAIDDFWHRADALLRAGTANARRIVAQGAHRLLPRQRRGGAGICA